MKRVRNEAPYERNIITYYFADAEEREEIKGSTRYAKYPRSAVQRAVDNMMMNTFGAQVCVIYDDYFGEDHTVITRTIEGNVFVKPLRDVTAPEVAGTSKDPFGGFAKKIAKSREKYITRPASEAFTQRKQKKGKA